MNDHNSVPEKGPGSLPLGPGGPPSDGIVLPKTDVEAQLAADPRLLEGTGYNAKTWYPRPEDIKETLLDTVYMWEFDGVWGYPIDGSPRFRLTPLQAGAVLEYTAPHDEHSDRSSHGSRDPASPSPSGVEGTPLPSAAGPCPSCGREGPTTAGWGPVEVVSASALFLAFGFGLGFILARSVL